MHLHCHGADAVRIKGLVGVQHGHGNDGTAGFYGAFEAAALEFSRMVPLLGSGSLREDEKVSAGNLPPKRVKTVRIDEKFPIYAEIAVQWWADALQSPRFDMGGNSELSFALQQLGMLKNKNQQASEESIMIFKTTLEESILEEIEKWGNCELRTDYQPDQILYEASKKAKLELSFPWKTRMNITEECVSVTEPGNGKKILWQANAEG